jgi:DNA-binding MurR/RpiR family transcriptional regulator
MRKAARYVTDNRSEVAFRSMRSVAKSAGVSPPTMVRLAKSLGFEGFDQLRQAFQDQIEPRDCFVTLFFAMTRFQSIRVSLSASECHP